MSTLDGKLCGSQELHSQELAFGCDGISDRVDSLTELPGDQDVDMLPNNLLLPGAADATHGAAVRLQATVRRRSVMCGDSTARLCCTVCGAKQSGKKRPC